MVSIATVIDAIAQDEYSKGRENVWDGEKETYHVVGAYSPSILGPLARRPICQQGIVQTRRRN